MMKIKTMFLSEITYAHFMQWAVYTSSGQLKKPNKKIIKIAQSIETGFVTDQANFSTVSFTAQSLVETTRNEGDHHASRSKV